MTPADACFGRPRAMIKQRKMCRMFDDARVA